MPSYPRTPDVADLKRLTAYLDPALYARIRQQATDERRSISSHVAHVLNLHCPPIPPIS